MTNKIELSDNDLDVIKLALRKCIKTRIDNYNSFNEGLSDSEKMTLDSPQNEIMQELHDRIDKVELFK